MQNTNGKRAIIIGASNGNGAELARHLACEGYQLTLQVRYEVRLKALCDRINSEVEIKLSVPPPQSGSGRELP
jgi:short-subunit dehydrogenase